MRYPLSRQLSVAGRMKAAKPIAEDFFTSSLFLPLVFYPAMPFHGTLPSIHQSISYNLGAFRSIGNGFSTVQVKHYAEADLMLYSLRQLLMQRVSLQILLLGLRVFFAWLLQILLPFLIICFFNLF